MNRWVYRMGKNSWNDCYQSLNNYFIQTARVVVGNRLFDSIHYMTNDTQQLFEQAVLQGLPVKKPRDCCQVTLTRHLQQTHKCNLVIKSFKEGSKTIVWIACPLWYCWIMKTKTSFLFASSHFSRMCKI